VQIKLEYPIRVYTVELNDKEIEDIINVIETHRGSLPEHAERFLNVLYNR
jgi:hypothetical protein